MCLVMDTLKAPKKYSKCNHNEVFKQINPGGSEDHRSGPHIHEMSYPGLRLKAETFVLTFLYFLRLLS